MFYLRSNKKLKARLFILAAVFAFVQFSTGAVFAQTKSGEQKPAAPKSDVKTLPGGAKVSQIDDAKLLELLKPKGRPLLINFWATWCDPCREEFPDLVRIENDYRGKIDVVTISLDDVAEINTTVKKFLTQMKAETQNYLLVTEDEGAIISQVSKDWSGGLPLTVFYNAEGGIEYFRQGKFKTDELRSKIDSLVQKAEPPAKEVKESR
jgi:thiol-disulfide isomerase/thioredoxin